MGGRGSGGWYRWEKKCSMEQALKLDIRYLRKQGFLREGNYILSWKWGNDGPVSRASIRVTDYEIIVSCNWENRETGERKSMAKAVRLVETACEYGGARKWFLCPRCESRMAVLVLHPPVVGCRHCLSLGYASQNENVAYRALRRRNKIARRLVRDEYFDVILERPKGMHWRTFNRLIEEHDHADQVSLFSAMGYWGFQ